MNKQVNFEDNLYLLLIRIKLVRDTLTLDMDPEIFFNKSLDDIDFIHQTLEIILKKIQDNQQRIDRESLLDHLLQIERQYSGVLSKILYGSGSISADENPALEEKLSTFQKACTERQETIEALGTAIGKYPKEPVISLDELNELLKDF
jgi:hypothetical protein